MINAISPIDGRYASKCKELQSQFSEHALIKHRLKVEIEYLLALNKLNLKNFPNLNKRQEFELLQIYKQFDIEEAEKVKQIEKRTNHDVKSVEYYLSSKLTELGMDSLVSFVHFALTSQDINNTAVPLLLKEALDKVIKPVLQNLKSHLQNRSSEWKGIAMLSRTHGQAASPTTVGKEIRVFVERISSQLKILTNLHIEAKFGGATGNFNAHLVAYPNVDWQKFADEFVESLGMKRQVTTTQIEHYDQMAAIFHAFVRINTILIDLNRDLWTYISMDYFTQKVNKGEVGSSTMPHKVNPIDFENAEGNLGFANAIFNHLASKLPISRLQRDLTDSTVSRNIGVPLAHSLIAYKSMLKGLSKLRLNKDKLEADLDANWAVVTEAIQTILRRERIPGAYELLKDLSRGENHITKSDIHDFIKSLEVEEDVKMELLNISPYNYTGYH